MWVVWIPFVLVTTGLVICIRGQRMVASTRSATVARFEAELATEAGTLLTLLTSPWLALTAVFIG
jgi:hypothetical protein